MDLLDSILNSMQKPPSASEAQKNAMKKQKEAMERKQKEEKHILNKFCKRVEEKISNFIKDGTKPYLQFEPMEQVYRSVIRDVATTAGAQVSNSISSPFYPAAGHESPLRIRAVWL